MRTLRLLDTFCKAGGASVGYHRAGFDVVGVDIQPQPHYPYRFIQTDALEYIAEHGHEYDAIHASPPCQAFCSLRHMPNAKQYPNLIPQTRATLIATGCPYVIENVVGAPLRSTIMLCGTMFGLRTKCGAELRRHRLFETNWLLMQHLYCQHYSNVISVYGDHPRDPWVTKNRKVISVHGGKARDRAAGRTISVVGTGLAKGGRTITVTGSTPQQNTVHNELRETFSVAEARHAMQCDWMTMRELSQAIPPAYTEFIGRQLREHITYCERAERLIGASK